VSEAEVSHDLARMKLNAILDIDLVAVESEDRVSVLLELTAPEGKINKKRQSSTLQVVLDRSGSMGDGRLEAAKRALDALIGRLDPTDNLGLVIFDNEVVAAVPAGALTDKHHVRQLIRSIYPGGSTNLSGGYLRGIQEARRVQGDQVATLLLISDGHANFGVTDPGELEKAAEVARANNVCTSTIGVGLGYDEVLMAAMARGGAGNTHFAEEADAAGAAIAAEVDHLLDQVLQAANLTVRPSGEVEAIRLFNDLPVVPIEDGFVIELGDFYSGETRKLLLEVDVPAMSELGLAQIAELELRYVEVGSLEAEAVTLPVHVNVVPGDAAAGRIPNPTVRSELAYQQAQRAKQQAIDALHSGDHAEAADYFAAAADDLEVTLGCAPEAMVDELAEETRLLRDLSARAMADDPSRVAKFTAMDRHYKERKRGRRQA
jgi:Ca-activated chloride channel family protein